MGARLAAAAPRGWGWRDALGLWPGPGDGDGLVEGGRSDMAVAAAVGSGPVLGLVSMDCLILGTGPIQKYGDFESSLGC